MGYCAIYCFCVVGNIVNPSSDPHRGGNAPVTRIPTDAKLEEEDETACRKEVFEITRCSECDMEINRRTLCRRLRLSTSRRI